MNPNWPDGKQDAYVDALVADAHGIASHAFDDGVFCRQISNDRKTPVIGTGTGDWEYTVYALPYEAGFLVWFHNVGVEEYHATCQFDREIAPTAVAIASKIYRDTLYNEGE